MPPESIDPLLVQNEERHETLKDISTISQHQLLKQDEISEGVKDLNKTAEMLLLQGDEQKNQTFEIEANDANSLALWNLFTIALRSLTLSKLSCGLAFFFAIVEVYTQM